MIRMNKVFIGVVCGLICASVLAAGPVPVDLRCEYRENPLGIDQIKPRLSWKIEVGVQRSGDDAVGRVPSPGVDHMADDARSGDRAYNGKKQIRRIKQTAYRVLVASSEELLKKNEADLWDSGRVDSDQSVNVEYNGKALESRMKCFWKVMVWVGGKDEGGRHETGKATDYSKTACWTMGLLKPDDFNASWIGYDAAYNFAPQEAADNGIFNIKGLQWHNMPGGKAGLATCFRKKFDIPADRKIRRAVLVLYAYHFCEASVNGSEIGSAAHWEKTARLDATKVVKQGANVVTLSASHTDPYPPAVIGKLVVQFESGDDIVVPVDNTWKVSQESGDGWKRQDFDDAGWANAQAGGYGFGVVGDVERVPTPYLRREFAVKDKIKRATVYVTALGTYELRLNGQRVGNDVLAPGWTEFRKRVHYQTYDVTELVKKGDNAIGAILGDGWYASVLAHHCRRKWYGGNPRFLAQLEIELADGTVQTITSDGSWKAVCGPIRHADLLMGCEYDFQAEMPGWDKAGFNDSAWKPVTAGSADETGSDVTAVVAAAVKDDSLSLSVENSNLGGDPAEGRLKTLHVEYVAGGKSDAVSVAEHGQVQLAGAGLKIKRAVYGHMPDKATFRLQASVVEPARVIDELPAVKVTEPRPGCWTFDLGQNMVGWVRLKVRGDAGQRITVRHGEMINADGTIYTAALRSCTATDFYILSGKGEEVLEPYFTFHGFRYVEVRGLKRKPDAGDVTGMVVHTPMERTGRFECSNPLLNQLYSNIIWGQKGNYLEVPTDCPQRDERMGWTGDTQFFAPTASYNFNVAPFFTRWLEACEDNQFGDGSMPHVVPDIMGSGGAMAWGCANLLCTYNIYRAYGDTRIVKDRFGMMERYMKWLAGRTKDGITKVGGFGDWLNAGGGASAEVVDTAYHAYEAGLMAEMAEAIGREEDAGRYAKLHDDLKASFVKNFVQEDGSIKGASQTGYALAFTMGLVPDDMREKLVSRFVVEIERFNWHLATGFIGTPRLLPALSLAGRDDVAYRLLLTDTYPSWLFPVKNGATTMWERWNGWTPEKGFGDIKMNSFNHYAFGAVGEYLYGGVGGIKAGSPGYKKIIIKPAIREGIDWANTSFDSVYGPVVCNWKKDSGRLTIDVEVPPNTTATVYVNAGDASQVTESGKPVDKVEGVRFLKMENGAAVYLVGSGCYRFESKNI